MSWQDHIDSLMRDGKVSRAAIIGQQGGIWASSKGYNLSPEDQGVVTGAFINPGEIQAHGALIAKKKYRCIRADDEFVHLVEHTNGCLFVKTKQAIIVAEYLDPIRVQECSPVVQRVADYLKSVQY